MLNRIIKNVLANLLLPVWRWRAGNSRVVFTVLIFFGGILLLGCGRTAPPIWPWWTAEDSAAVREALKPWRAFLNSSYITGDTFRLGFSVGLNYQDSSSRTGDTLYKFAHIIRAWIEPGDSVHQDIYQFGVTVDTVTMADTFCQVIYQDSMSGCRLQVEYDTLWVVGFRPDTIVDTTKSPPETTIVQRVSYVERRGFSEIQQAVKSYNWGSRRWLFLRRDTLPETLYYSLIKISGGYVRIPNAEGSPQISRVIFSKPGQVDTIFYSPRSDGKGLTNLRSVDSLYLVRVGEEITVSVVTSTPQDTVADKNRFFVMISQKKQDITIGAKEGKGVCRFSAADTGYQHIYIEVLPATNLLYPDAPYNGTVWMIPVRVVSE